MVLVHYEHCNATSVQGDHSVINALSPNNQLVHCLPVTKTLFPINSVSFQMNSVFFSHSPSVHICNNSVIAQP